jgi:diadenosine tetraphosphate (Ap4A) HIT family hydrolase
MKESCIFCNKEEIKEAVLWETDSFFVKVGVGILAPGHVMIISKEHLSCFGELPNRLDEEFVLLKNEIFNRLRAKFSEPLIYEHGVYSQSVNHAHMHFVPKKSKLFSFKDLNKKIFRKLESREVDNLFDIKDVFYRYVSYLYFEEDERKWVFFTKGLPEKKYDFRKEFVRLTGFSELLNWRTMSEEAKRKNEEWVELTREKLI